jgi:hypothetical protein
MYVRIFRVLSVKYTNPVLKSFLLQKYAKWVISPNHQDWQFKLFFTKKYGQLLRFSGQGVEKINDDIQKIHHSKTNKWDATVDALQVRKRIEHFGSFSEYLSDTSDISSEILAFLAALGLKLYHSNTRSYIWCSFAYHARSSLMSNVLEINF